MATKTWYSLQETANLLGVHYQTVWHMVEKGYLKTSRLTPRSPHRVSPAELKKHLGETPPAPTERPATTLRDLARA